MLEAHNPEEIGQKKGPALRAASALSLAPITGVRGETVRKGVLGLVRARIWPVYGGRNGPRSAFSADLRATPQTHRRLFGKSRKENSANFVFTEFLRS